MTSISTPRCSADELAARLERPGVSVIDVRKPMEFAAGHIPGSRNVPLAQLAGAALPEGQVRSIDKQRIRRRYGKVSTTELEAIDAGLCLYLGLEPEAEASDR